MVKFGIAPLESWRKKANFNHDWRKKANFVPFWEPPILMNTKVLRHQKDPWRRCNVDNLRSCRAKISTQNYKSFFLFVDYKDLKGFDWRLTISFTRRPGQSEKTAPLAVSEGSQDSSSLSKTQQARSIILIATILFIYIYTHFRRVAGLIRGHHQITQTTRWIWLRCQWLWESVDLRWSQRISDFRTHSLSWTHDFSGSALG